ncbi:MAG TPA: DUF3073 domain-containing protein [Micromonosporaceae bacterium]|nr:DUF3073 domain-containing protein [Micromonosporaceae bacterium]
MGRGRAKAKQTRVARELKYHSPDTDLTALQRELASSGRASDSKFGDAADSADDAEEDDPVEEDDFDRGPGAARRR